MARNSGEVIYESLAEERRGEEDSQVIIEIKDTENISGKHLEPNVAFEYFHGKIYDIPSQRAKTEFSLADKVERRVESPFQRYARLRAEVQELQSDVSLMLQENQKSSQSYQNVWTTLQLEATHLLHNLDGFQDQIAKVSEPVTQTRLDELTNLTSSVMAPAADAADKPPKHNSSSSDSSGNSSSAAYLTSLELRVASLEGLLGSASNSLDLEGVVGVTVHGRSYPLLDKLTMLERKVNMLDPATLESIRSKAYSLKSELEDIQRERIRSGGATHKVLEAAKKVEALSDNVAHITSVSDELPAVVLRLKTLETLHHEAASFHVRLSEATETLARLSSEVDSNTETLASLKTGFVENISIVQKNLSELNSRITQTKQAP